MLALLILLQSVSGPPGDAPVAAPPPRCAAESGDEILVCATDQQAYRLNPVLEPARRDGLPLAQVKIGPAAAAARVENSPIPTVSAPRLMIDLKTGF